MAVVLFVYASIALADSEILIQEVGFVGSSANVATGEFELTESGRYTFSITDLSTQDVNNEFLEPFEDLNALIIKDDQEYITKFSSDLSTSNIQLEPGIYQIIIHGTSLQTSGKISQYSANVILENQETPVYTKVGFIPELSNETKIEDGFINPIGIEEDGDYKIYLTNFAFPKSLQHLQLLVANNADHSSSFQLDASNSTQAISSIFSATAGNTLTIATIAVADESVGKGLFGIKMVKVVGEYELSVFETVIPVGEEDGTTDNDVTTLHQGFFTVPENTGGTQNLQFSDLRSATTVLVDNEDSFIESIGYIIQDAITNNVILNTTATEETTELGLPSGDYVIRLFVNSSITQEEIFGIRISDKASNERIYDYTQVIGKGFLHSTQLPALAQQTKLIIADLCERARFSQLALILSNGVDIIDTVKIEYSANDPSYCSSPVVEDVEVITSSSLSYQAHIYALAPEETDQGTIRPALFNMQIINADSDTLIYENTGSMQGDYSCMGYEFDITSEDGTGTISLIDYAFPQNFADIKLVITQGTDKVTIFTTSEAGSSYTYDSLQSGKYFATVIADLADESALSTYGIKMTYKPATNVPPVDNQTGDGGSDSSGSGGGGNTSLLLVLMLLLGANIRNNK